MTKIKICGIRSEADVAIMNEYHPEYVGFIFAESKRKVTIQEAKHLSELLEDGIETVGVFVNSGISYIADAVKEVGLTAVQLHGDENAEYIEALKRRIDCEIWKAIRIQSGNDIDHMQSVAVKRIVLDKYREDSYGGSGETFDWSEISGKPMSQSIILAGGLHVDNVIDGIKLFSPYAVDVSSNVETDGMKDKEKVKKFIEKIRMR